ncbi:hypothetical protein [Novosphingobium panipatense]|nr:hypothetical protein [Novosphingobium panipatense]
MHLSKVSAATLLKVIGFLFWVIGIAGALSLSAAAIRWVADGVPLPPRQSAFDATLLLAGWVVSRLCAILRTRLKGSDQGDPPGPGATPRDGGVRRRQGGGAGAA